MPVDQYFRPDVLGYYNLTTGAFSLAKTGSAFKWPKKRLGDTLNVAIRFTKIVDGKTVEVERPVKRLWCSLGESDERPTSGKFRILVGDQGAAQNNGVNTTAELNWNDDAAAWSVALNAISDVGAGGLFGAATVTEDNDSKIITFAGEVDHVGLGLVENSLGPVAFMRVLEDVEDGVYLHAARLIVAPYAWTSKSVNAVPEPPSVEIFVAGSTTEESKTDESWHLKLQREFRGTYQLRRGLKKSADLSRASRVAQISEAINPVAFDDLRIGDDAEASFQVDLIRDGLARITFGGSMAGTNYGDLELHVVEAPVGDLSFSLPLKRMRLAEALRSQKEITAPLEIKIEFDEQNVEEEDSVISYRSELTVEREVGWLELNEIDDTDWSRPHVRTDYIASDGSEVNTGFANKYLLFGAAVNTAFDHNLDSHFVHFLIRDNTVPGKVLVEGVDYTLDRTPGKNTTNLVLIGAYNPAPGVGTLEAVAVAYEAADKWSIHNQAIETITGGTGDLRAILDGMQAEIDALQASSGQGVTFTVPAEEPIARTWPIPPLVELVGARNPRAIALPENLGELDPLTLPRAGRLLRAVFSAAPGVLPLPVPAPSAATKFNVYQWDGNPDSSGLVEQLKLKSGDYVTNNGDNGLWYRVEQFVEPPAAAGGGSSSSSGSSGSGSSGSSSSSEPVPGNAFYPSRLVRTLFEFSVNSKQFKRRSVLELAAGLEMLLVRDITNRRPRDRDANFHYSLVIEIGDLPAESAPAPVGGNLELTTWRPVPVFECPIVVTPTAIVHNFGLRMSRSSADVMSLEYSAENGDLALGAEAAKPDGFDFAVRGRLVRPDAGNFENPRGFVALSGFARIAPGASGAAGLGTVTIN